MWMRGPVFGRCGATQEDLLKNFEREVRETERKCVMLFWFGWMGRLLEVRRGGRETMGRVGTGRLFGHMTNTTSCHYYMSFLHWVIRRTLSRFRALRPSLRHSLPASRSLRTFTFFCEASIEPGNSSSLTDAVEVRESSTRQHTVARDLRRLSRISAGFVGPL
jgi:hypothetical protein